MKTIILLALLTTARGADCIKKPCSLAANFSADIKGDPDTRVDTWGTAGAVFKRITFTQKPGYRVRILRVYGDFLIWPMGKVKQGRFAGALFGLQTTAPDGSIRADWAADNCFLYVQVATGGGPARSAFDYDTKAGGLLEADGVLVLKMAGWLNDTGLAIHMEPSFVVVYQLEK